MNVTAYLPLYPPHSRVGAWLATHYYLRALATNHHIVNVVTRLGTSDYLYEDIRVESGRKGRSAPTRRLKTADLIIGHCGDNGWAESFASQRNVPFVKFAHGLHPDPGAADVVVFNSKWLADATAANRKLVCHPPVNRPAHQVEATGNRVTLVNLSPHKGIDTAWAAAEQLPGYDFLGVKGGYGEQITARATNFHTISTQTDMRNVWAQTRLLLFPSAFETWGMVPIEAGVNGIPTIAHPTKGTKEALGDAALYTDRDDWPAWVDTIRGFDNPDFYLERSEIVASRVEELERLIDEQTHEFVQTIEGLL